MYVYLKIKDMTFQDNKQVLLMVSSMKGTMRFVEKGKVSQSSLYLPI